MLILAAIVTFLSIYNAIYVPSMKESSEIDHLQNVETGFVHFSSDIDQAISSHQDSLVFSEPVPLGGGDTLVNELKSSGTLQVQNESVPVYTLTFSDGTVVNGIIVNFSYEPVGNFWQDQGYTWQYGYINVTKNGGSLSTPLNYYNMTDVNNAFGSPGTPLNEFASSLGGVSYTQYQTPVPETDSNGDVRKDTNGNTIYYVPAGYCSSISLVAVNISASSKNFISSNGYGTLTLTTNATPVIFSQPITSVAISSDGSPFGNAALTSWNAGFSDLMGQCSKSITNSSLTQYNLINQNEYPTNVNLTVMQVTVGAH
jgi:hypothetical protein